VRREQLPVRLRRARPRHRQRAGRWLPGGGEGAPGASAAVRPAGRDRRRSNGGRGSHHGPWRAAIDTVEALRPRHIVCGHQNKELDDDAGRTIAETRQYLDDADELLLTATFESVREIILSSWP
jgi:hypothetical protein